MSKTEYPKSLEEIKNASHEQICSWYRFLPSPISPQQRDLMNFIIYRFQELGGMTPETSKKIGW